MLEVLVGLHVVDEGSYKAYRQGMKPILNQMGGGFRYDFQVSEIYAEDISQEFLAKTEQTINRVFVIYFPDSRIRDQFYQHQDYLDIKKKYFEPAVATRVTLAEWYR